MRDNPLFKRLELKEKQLSGVPDGALKIIFVADSGSRLLRHINDSDLQHLHKSAAEIIRHFLDNSSVHEVCVFSPQRESFFPRSTTLSWRVSMFCKSESIFEIEKLNRLKAILPAPRFEGYQARSLQKQGVFKPSANGWYLGTTLMGRNSATMKISARLLQEFLAGKISRQQFERSAFGGRNEFDAQLRNGYTIKNTKVEGAGIDEDDDYIVFEFAFDLAAGPLKLKS